MRLVLHAGGRPLRPDRLLPGGDLRLQPRPPRHPLPHRLVAAEGRHSWPPGRWSASPIREPTPPTATPSCAKAMGSFAQHLSLRQHGVRRAGPCSPTGPRRAPCGATACRRPRFADEANIDECAAAVGMDPLEYRMQYIMPKDYRRRLLQQYQLFRLLPGLSGKGP